MSINAKKLASLLLLALLAAGGRSFAHGATTGTYSGDFMKLGAGVRAEAMGGAFIAVSDDNSAQYYNPAGLSKIKKYIITSQYSSWLAGISYTNLSASNRSGDNAFGLGVSYVNAGAIEESTAANPAGTGRMFNPSDQVITVTYARRLGNNAGVGISAKCLNESIDSDPISGYSADIGALVDFNDSWSAGVSGRNIIGFLGKRSPAKNLGAGIAFRQPNYIVAFDANIPSDNVMLLNLGCEYNLSEILFLRAGFNTRAEDGSGGFMGAGIGFKAKDMNFDYAYVPYGDLGVTHRFSLSFSPEGKKGTKEAAQQERAETASIQKQAPVKAGGLSEIKVYPPKIKLKKGESFSFIGTGYGSSGMAEKLPLSFWEVEGDIGNIDPIYGFFTATKQGKGYVVLNSGGIKGRCEVTVINKKAAIKGKPAKKAKNKRIVTKNKNSKR